MNVTDQNQYKLGLAGLAFLRNWLTGERSKNEAILQDMKTTLVMVDAEKAEKNPLEKYNIDTGYAKWAGNYDEMPNLLIDAEEPVVRSVLLKIKPGTAIDVACGTGRYSSILQMLGHRVVGADQSPQMLEIAKQKCPNVNFILSDVTHLPLTEKSFDFAISALALTHFIKLDEAIREIARLVKEDGTIILSDIHPMIVALGGHADFQGKTGDRGFIVNHVHWHGEYLQAFKKYDLEVMECLEPKLKPEHTRILQEAFSLNETTVQTALDGLPIALIWVLRKRYPKL